MSISENIRRLGRDGHSPAEVAKAIGVRYQHAYNVLSKANLLNRSRSKLSHESSLPRPKKISPKPDLTRSFLLASGFQSSALWTLSSTGDIVSDQALPRNVGVYAFARGETVLYVGVATCGLFKRLKPYQKPNVSQKTNWRINTLIKTELGACRTIEVLTAQPLDFEWNGLPVRGDVGLELGIISRFSLPWNIRSAR